MNFLTVKSSNVSSVGYDEKNAILEIRFRSGGHYRYYDVKREVFDKIGVAESVGKFVNESVVRGGYKHLKVSGNWRIAKDTLETPEINQKPLTQPGEATNPTSLLPMV